MQNIKLRYDIQFLRAFAVLAVIGYHYKIRGFEGGFIGVDLFFVISGYLIFSQLYQKITDKDFSIKRFLEARFRRIFPALSLVSLLVVALGWKYDLPRHYVSSVRDALATLFFVSNKAFSAIGYFDSSSETRPLLHTWSLAIEAQFYFALAILCACLSRHSQKLKLFLIIIFWVSLLLACYLAYFYPINGFYSIFARIWEFLAGSMLVFLKPASKKKFPDQYFYSILFALILCVFFIANDTAWPGLITLLPVALAASLIYFGMQFQKNNIVSSPITQFIGDMSYSLYLYHWPIWVFANQLYENQISSQIKVLLLLITFFCSLLSYRFVEQPFRSRNIVTTKSFFFLTSFVLVFSLATTYFVLSHKGFPNRFESYVARTFQARSIPTPRKECFRSREGTKKFPGQFCTFGEGKDEKNASIILWGDSHANQYLSPISSASSQLHKTGLIATIAGCGPSLGNKVYHYNYFFLKYPKNLPNQYSPSCDSFNKELLDYLKTHRNIKTVILGRRWTNDQERFQISISLVKFLVEDGRKVIITGPLPYPERDVEVWWAREQIKLKHPIDEITFDRTANNTFSESLTHFKELFNTEISENKIVIVDPTSKLCNAEKCYAVRNDKAYFRDTNHLTEVSSLLMLPDFVSALRQLNE